MSTALEKLREIKENGVKAANDSVNALLTDDGQRSFSFLIERAKQREQAALSKINTKYLSSDGTVDLNNVVAIIDNNLNLGELLAGGAVERYIQDLGYIIEAKGSKKERNKNEDEKNESLVTVLSPSQQLLIIDHITEKFTNEILNNVMAKSGSNFISNARGIVVDLANSYFLNLITETLNKYNLSLKNIDLGKLEVKINTRGIYLKAGKRINTAQVEIDKDAFKITSAGDFFNDMTPLALLLLYAITQDELGNKEYLKKFIDKYNSRDNIKYLQDLDRDSAMSIVREALNNVCPAAIPAFDKYGIEIAYKGAKANLRGGLGELRSLCIIEELFPGLQYNAAGLSKVTIGTSTEKESPIDAILTLLKDLLKIGIQSKNTNKNIYNGWKVDKSDAMTMTSFYSQRLNETLDGDEEIFFNALSYNLPLEKKGPYNREWLSMIDNPAFINKFNALVYKIIRQEIIDTADVIYINDFFFMNDKIIPSSAILTQILNNVLSRYRGSTSTKTTNDYLSTSFNYIPNNNLVWNEQNGYDDDGNPFFARGSAANVKIYYSINLNINNMASLAMSAFNP